jgi:hypothetical protein
MEVVSVCPLRVASVVWQPPRGGFTLTVIAKATFRLLPGEARLAEEQEYPNDDDNHWNDDPARSLYSPSDLVPFKPRPDILLVGHAFAPRKEPVRSLVARLTIGDIDKAIEVTGDRAFSPDGKLREPARFVKMPLRYERTAGGPDTWNPVGVRSDARPDAYGAVPLPNLLPAGSAATSRVEIYSPIAFGPIAPTWPSRRKHLGRSAARMAGRAWNEGPLPEDLDPAYFNSAPEDQRPKELRDDQKMVLENLHPDHPRLLTRLPGLRPCAFIDIAGMPPQRIHMECDTLWIDTDRSICTMVWRGQVPLETASVKGRVLVAMEEGQGHLSWGDLQRKLAGTEAQAAQEGTAIIELVSVKEPPPSQMTPPPASPQPEAIDTGIGPITPTALASTGGFPRASLPLPPPPAAPTAAALSPPPAVTTDGALLSAVTTDGVLPASVAPTIDVASMPVPGGPARPAPRSAVPGGVIDLLWFDPAVVPRLRLLPAYRELLASMARGPEPGDTSERRAAFDVLARAGATDEEGLFGAMASAVSESGQLEPPLLVVEGELCAVFDEAARRSLGRSHNDALAERELLAQRAYQRRAVFGGPHLCAHITLLGGSEAIPAYLPEALSAWLPMFARIRARVLAEAHLPQDQHEAHPVSLRVFAVGRVT